MGEFSPGHDNAGAGKCSEPHHLLVPVAGGNVVCERDFINFITVRLGLEDASDRSSTAHSSWDFDAAVPATAGSDAVAH